MNDDGTEDLSLLGECFVEKEESSTAACTVTKVRIFCGTTLIQSTEMRKWIYPNPFDNSPGFNALERTEEEWPSLAWDGSVVEPDVPEAVDVTLRLYSSVGLDEDNHESQYGFLGSGEERTYVHHAKRYMYGADDHLYPETEWNGGVYYYQHPRSHWHNTKSEDGTVLEFNALIRNDQEWPSLSSHPPDDFSERTFHPFSKLPPELQVMVLERSDLVFNTPKHGGIYLRTDRCVALNATIHHRIPMMAACSCAPDCWQKWNGSCCCGHKRLLYRENNPSFDAWPGCPNHECYRNGFMGTSKWIREEALKIFYGRNQFCVEGSLQDIINVLKTNHEYWPEEMSLIKHLCARLYVGDWSLCDQSDRDEFLRCIKGLLSTEKLGIRFVVCVPEWGSEPPMTLLNGFCKQIMEAELGVVEVFRHEIV